MPTMFPRIRSIAKTFFKSSTLKRHASRHKYCVLVLRTKIVILDKNPLVPPPSPSCQSQLVPEEDGHLA